MSIFNLPAELKLNIVEELDPVSSFQFAFTNKEHSRLCENIIQEHKELFVKYRCIDVTNPGSEPWAVLKDVLQDPRKGRYVRELNLPSSREDTDNKIISEEDLKLYTTAAQNLSSFYYGDLHKSACSQEIPFFAAAPDDDINDFETELINLIESGQEEAFIVLLIHHLPHLTSIRMTVGHRMGVIIFSFLRRVAECYQNPELAPRMPLQHLKVAAIAHYDSEGCCDVEWAVYFLCIPSLRTFAALRMGSEDVLEEAHLRTVAGTAVSNAEELRFDSCQFDSKSLQLLLPMIKDLKKFSYSAGGAVVTYADLEPRKVLQALSTSVGHSVEEIDIIGCDAGFENGEYDLDFVSLRDFKVLKVLHCETRWCLASGDTDLGNGEALSQGFHTLDDAGEKTGDPRDNLPSSLEELYLNDIHTDDEWDQLVELFKSTNPQTPKLTLESTCVIRRSERTGNMVEKFGGAVGSIRKFLGYLTDDDLAVKLWEGHGY